MNKKSDLPTSRKETLDKLLDNDHVLLHVLTSFEGVQIPEYLKSSPSVTLKISRAFRGALVVGDEQIDAELSFKGNYFSCVIPLNSIWGVSTPDGKSLVWPETAPAEVLSSVIAEMKKKEEESLRQQEEQTIGKPRGHLRRVK